MANPVVNLPSPEGSESSPILPYTSISNPGEASSENGQDLIPSHVLNDTEPGSPSPVSSDHAEEPKAITEDITSKSKEIEAQVVPVVTIEQNTQREDSELGDLSQEKEVGIVDSPPVISPKDITPDSGKVSSELASWDGSNEIDPIPGPLDSEGRLGSPRLSTGESNDEFRRPNTEPMADKSSESTENKSVYFPVDNEEYAEFEDVEYYKEGGYHPVHLEDVLDDRYEVVTKLGQGGFATVWLCIHIQDKTWRAVKILTADKSREDAPDARVIEMLKDSGAEPQEWEAAHIQLPIDQFWLDGPNGRHLCLVLPVFGPTLGYHRNTEDLATKKKLLLQVARGLQFLHRHGIIHGDFRTENILLRVGDIDRLDREQMLDLLGRPVAEDVRRRVDSLPGPHAPRYLVEAADLSPLGVKDEIVIVDFGVSSHVDSPLVFTGIPDSFAAPEAYFGLYPGLPGDVWSFAMTIANIRLCAPLVSGRTSELYVQSLEYLLGPLPEPYRAGHIQDLKGLYPERELLDDIGPDGMFQPLSMSYEELKRTQERKAKMLGISDPLEGLVGQERGLYKRPTDDNDEYDYTASHQFFSNKVPLEELPVLVDLFRKVMRYDPKERIDINEVVQHEWFQQGEASPKTGTNPAFQAESQPEPARIRSNLGGHAVESDSRAKTNTIPERPGVRGNTSPKPLKAEKQGLVKDSQKTDTRDLIWIGFAVATSIWLMCLAIFFRGIRSPPEAFSDNPCGASFFYAQARKISDTSVYFEGVITLPEQAMTKDGEPCPVLMDMGGIGAAPQAIDGPAQELA